MKAGRQRVPTAGSAPLQHNLDAACKPRDACSKKQVRQNLHDLASLTILEKKVYTALARVPKGKVTTYGELARAVGLGGGQRAIGRIMNKNPYPVIIPCHRVVMSTGDVGGYAHGSGVKESMLASEGVRITGSKIADMPGALYRFDVGQ